MVQEGPLTNKGCNNNIKIENKAWIEKKGFSTETLRERLLSELEKKNPPWNKT